MPNPRKRSISAREIAHDIKAELPKSQLLTKYQLSEEDLEAVCHRLVESGLIDASDLALPRGAEHRSLQAPSQPKPRAGWYCPACGAPHAAEVAECERCGAVAAKILARRRAVERRQESHPVGSEPAASGANKRVIVFVSIVAFLFVGGLIVLWSIFRAAMSVETATSPTPLSANVKHFTTVNFGREALEASKTQPVLLEFYADW